MPVFTNQQKHLNDSFLAFIADLLDSRLPNSKQHRLQFIFRPLEVSVDLILIALTDAAFEPAFTHFDCLLFAPHDVTSVLLTQTAQQCRSSPSILCQPSAGLHSLNADSVQFRRNSAT